MWEAWRFVTDGGDYDEGIVARLVGLVLVLSGMLFFALLIGLIGESIQTKLEGLKHGRNRVVESNHTLVLGWSEHVLSLCQEIAKANESEGGGVVVVLADDLSKEDMDARAAEESEGWTKEMRQTQVVCRHGDPVLLSDLKKVSAGAARAVVVLARYDVAPDASDARAVRCLLALNAGLPSLAGHVVVELRDVDNLPTVELVSKLANKQQGEKKKKKEKKEKKKEKKNDDDDDDDDDGNDEAVGNDSDNKNINNVQALVPHDIIGRLMIQCARQAHLPEVYDALCGFDGAEFYFKEWPLLVGRRWGDALFAFADACPIGVRSSGGGEKDDGEGILRLNPSDDYVVQEGDEIVVIAEDDDTYEVVAVEEGGAVVADDDDDDAAAAAAVAATHRPDAGPPPRFFGSAAGGGSNLNQNMLLCGWRRDLYDMLSELDKYVDPGTEVVVLAHVPLGEREALLEEGKARKLQLRRLKLHHVRGSTILRRDLEAVMHAHSFGSVLVLATEVEGGQAHEGGGGDEGGGGGSGSTSSQGVASDSRALSTLLLVSDIRRAMLASAAAAAAAKAAKAIAGAAANGSAGSAAAVAAAAATEVQSDDAFTLIGEIRDAETKDLVAAAGVGDCIMSNRIIAKVLAMVAEQQGVGPLFDVLFAEEGDELYVRDARHYAYLPQSLSFWDMGARARALGDVAIGYKRGGGDVVLNPPDKRKLLEWDEGDYLIIIGDH